MVIISGLAFQPGQSCGYFMGLRAMNRVTESLYGGQVDVYTVSENIWKKCYLVYYLADCSPFLLSHNLPDIWTCTDVVLLVQHQFLLVKAWGSAHISSIFIETKLPCSKHVPSFAYIIECISTRVAIPTATSLEYFTESTVFEIRPICWVQDLWKLTQSWTHLDVSSLALQTCGNCGNPDCLPGNHSASISVGSDIVCLTSHLICAST